MAPLSNFIDVTTTIGDLVNTKEEIADPDIISYKKMNPESNKKPSAIISEGNGIMKKKDKDDVSCYYFVVKYTFCPMGYKKGNKM